MTDDARAKLEDVYREQGDRLWRSVLLYAGDSEVASDAVAEAFAQALHRGEAIHHPDLWVWRTAFRIAAGELKRRRRTIEMPPDLAYDLPEETAELLAALPNLSAKQRASVILHYHAGYSYAETATIIGSTQSAVGVHLSRARARLRRELGDTDG